MIHSNVFKDFELPPMPFAGRVLSEAEIKSLLSALPAKCARMVTVYLYTGLRAKELTTLQWWQVRDDHICIPADKEKSSRGRCIPIDDRVKFHLGRRGGEFDKVAEVCYDTLRETIVKAAKALALGRIKIHDFRHTCVTRFFEHSDDVWAACDIFGWADPKSAEPYIHMTKKRRAKVLHISYPCLEQSPGPGPLPS